jgi:predicted DNA-binding protein
VVKGERKGKGKAGFVLEEVVEQVINSVGDCYLFQGRAGARAIRLLQLLLFISLHAT